MDPLAGHQAALGHWLGTGLTSSYTSPTPKAPPPASYQQDRSFSGEGGSSYLRRADSIGYDVPPYNNAPPNVDYSTNRSHSVTSPHPSQPALSAASPRPPSQAAVVTTTPNMGTAVRMGKPDGLRGFGDLGPDVAMQETSHRQKGRGVPFGSQPYGGDEPDPLSTGPESRAKRKQQFASALKSVLGDDAEPTTPMAVPSPSSRRQQSDVGLVGGAAPYPSTVPSSHPSTTSIPPQPNHPSPHLQQHYTTAQPSEHHQHQYHNQHPVDDVPHEESIEERRRRYRDKQQQHIPQQHPSGGVYTPTNTSVDVPQYTVVQTYDHPYRHHPHPQEQPVQNDAHRGMSTHQHQEEAGEYSSPMYNQQSQHHHPRNDQDDLLPYPHPASFHNQSHEGRSVHFDHHEPVQRQYVEHHDERGHFQNADYTEHGQYPPQQHTGGHHSVHHPSEFPSPNNVPTTDHHNYNSNQHYAGQQQQQGARFNGPPAHYDPIHNRYYDDNSGADEYQPSEMDVGERGSETYERPSHDHSSQYHDYYQHERQHPTIEHSNYHNGHVGAPSSSGASVDPAPSAVSRGYESAPDAYSAHITPVASSMAAPLPTSGGYVAPQPQTQSPTIQQRQPSPFRGVALANYRTVSGFGPRVPRRVVEDDQPSHHAHGAISRISSLGIRQVATTPEEDATNPLLEAFRAQTDSSHGPTPTRLSTTNDVAPMAMKDDTTRSVGTRSALETPLPWMHHLLDEEQADAHTHWIKTGMAIEQAHVALETRSAQVSAVPSQKRAQFIDAATNVTRLQSIADSVSPRRAVDMGTAARTPSGRSDIAARRVQSERPMPPDMPPPASSILDPIPQSPMGDTANTVQYEAYEEHQPAPADTQLLEAARVHEDEKQQLLQEMYTLQLQGRDKEAALLKQIEALASERKDLLDRQEKQQQAAVVDATPQRPSYPPSSNIHSAPAMEVRTSYHTGPDDQSSPNRSLPALSGHNRRTAHGTSSPAHNGVFNGHTPDSHGPRREVHTPQSLETHARTPPPAIQQSPLPRHPDQRRDVSINNASVKSTIDVVTVVQPQQQLPHQPITLPQRSSVESFDESSNGGQVGEDPALASLRNTLAQLLRHQRQLLDQFEGSKGDYEEAVNIRMSLERAANNEEKEHARLVAMEEEEIARAEAKLQGLKTENRQLRSDLRRIAA